VQVRGAGGVGCGGGDRACLCAQSRWRLRLRSLVVSRWRAAARSREQDTGSRRQSATRLTGRVRLLARLLSRMAPARAAVSVALVGTLVVCALALAAWSVAGGERHRVELAPYYTPPKTNPKVCVCRVVCWVVKSCRTGPVGTAVGVATFAVSPTAAGHQCCGRCRPVDASCRLGAPGGAGVRAVCPQQTREQLGSDWGATLGTAESFASMLGRAGCLQANLSQQSVAKRLRMGRCGGASAPSKSSSGWGIFAASRQWQTPGSADEM